MHVAIGFLRTIYFFLAIKLVRVLGHICPAAADWVGERSGLNDRLLAFLGVAPDGQA
jgi:hypothetical protein